MKKIINKIGKVLQVILVAPVKLPNKALNVVRYIALGLGIVESVIGDHDEAAVDPEKRAIPSGKPEERKTAAPLDPERLAVNEMPKKGAEDAHQ